MWYLHYHTEREPLEVELGTANVAAGREPQRNRNGDEWATVRQRPLSSLERRHRELAGAMVAADQSIHGYVLRESKYRADQRQSQFQSATPRFPKPKSDERVPPGPGEYPGADAFGKMGESPTPTVSRSDRFKRLSQKQLEEQQGADPYYTEAMEMKRGWSGRQARTISRIGRSSPAIGAAPNKSVADRFYNTQKNDLSRSLKKSGNQYVGMRSRQKRFQDAYQSSTAPKVGPGGYDAKQMWEIQREPAEGRIKRGSFFMRLPSEKNARQKPTAAAGGARRETSKGSPGPGSYDYDPGFGRSQSVMSARSGSSAFLSPGRSAGNGRASRIARRVAEGNSMAIPSGTEHIDTNWRLSTDAKQWTARGVPEAFDASVAKMDRPFDRQFANRSPSVSRSRLKDASVRHEMVSPATMGGGSSRWGGDLPVQPDSQIASQESIRAASAMA